MSLSYVQEWEALGRSGDDKVTETTRRFAREKQEQQEKTCARTVDGAPQVKNTLDPVRAKNLVRRWSKPLAMPNFSRTRENDAGARLRPFAT